MGTVECITPVYDGIPAAATMLPLGLNVEHHVVPGLYLSFLYNQSGSLVKWFRDTFAAAEGKDIYPKLLAEMQVMAKMADPEKFDNQEEAVVRAKQMASDYVKNRAVLAGAKDVKVMVEAFESCGGKDSVMLKHSSNWIKVCARAIGDPV